VLYYSYIQNLHVDSQDAGKEICASKTSLNYTNSGNETVIRANYLTFLPNIRHRVDAGQPEACLL
jgi:hypothetical protein